MTSPGKENEELRRLRWLERVIAFSLELYQKRELSDLSRWSVDRLIELSGAQRGFLATRKDGQWRVEAARSQRGEDLPDPEQHLSHALLARAADSAEPFIVDNAAGAVHFSEEESITKQGIRSVLAVPLCARNQVIAVCYLDHLAAAGMFDEKLLPLMKLFSRPSAVAIENAQLLKESNEMAEELKRRNRELRAEVNQTREQLKESDSRLKTARERLGRQEVPVLLVGRSVAMRRLRERIAQVAAANVPVLIKGESGTGKELVARAIHQQSDRCSYPFVSQNCAALPEALRESELFGYRAGAFTGAEQDKPGLFQLASGGTIFLDEIGEMAPPLQAKLLSVWREGTVRPLGSESEVKVDIRIICATNRDLSDLAETGRFRSDLFFRLNAVTISAPPLRTHPEDLPLLIEHYLRERKTPSPSSLRFSSEASDLLTRYHWPGNVRELEHLLEQLLIFHSDREITLEILLNEFPHLAAAPDSVQDSAYLSARHEVERQFHRDFLSRALKESRGNILQAARRLDLRRQTLQTLIHKYGINPEDCT